MKLILVNNTEFDVTRVNRAINSNDSNISLDITIKTKKELEEIKRLLTPEAIATLTITRDDGDPVVFTGYELTTIRQFMDNITTNPDTVIVNFKKEVN